MANTEEEKREGSVKDLDNGVGEDDLQDKLEDDEASPAEENGENAEKSKVVKSTSNLFETLHAGRPKDEEPHIKKTMKNKKEKIEYIVRVDTEELGIVEDEFEDLQSLFQLFDHDEDGVLSIREAARVLKCLGFPHNEEEAKNLIEPISADKTGFSLSFNEYLNLVSAARRVEPNEDILVEVLKGFDEDETGKITERKFKQVMRTKEGVSDDEINMMLSEYFKHTGETREEDEENSFIDYRVFAKMLQS